MFLNERVCRDIDISTKKSTETRLWCKDKNRNGLREENRSDIGWS